MDTWDQDVAAARREASSIDEHHAAIAGMGRRGLAHAYCIGVALVEKKGMMGRGEWLPWVQQSLPFAQQQASRYMQFARLRDTVETTLPSVFSLEEAIRALAPPRKRKPSCAQQAKRDQEATSTAEAEVQATTEAAKPGKKRPPPRPEELPRQPPPAPPPQLPPEVDDELAGLASRDDDLRKLVTLIRHDELWIDPHRARKAIAKEIVLLYQRVDENAA